MRRPLCVDLFSGLGGWSDGFIAEGWNCIGFDIERHAYGDQRYPGQLVLQDVLTLHGSQFKDAACIVASPPCQEYSYMAMPWSRAKQIAAGLRYKDHFPTDYTGSRCVTALNALFNACFRIQREASEAAEHHIPLIVENVKGAQPWVGKAKANYGSFYLWGDIASIGGRIIRPDRVEFGVATVVASKRKMSGRSLNAGEGKWRPANGLGFEASDQLPEADDSQKIPGFNFHQFEQTGQPGGSFQSAAVKNGGDWFASGADCSEQRRHGSKSSARKAASAQIARIPFPLAQHIARIYYPDKAAEAS